MEAIRDGTRPICVALLPLPDLEGKAALVALTVDRSFAAAVLLDGEGEVDAEWTHFLEQMQFQVAPVVEESQPVASLTELRSELRGEEDEDSRLSLALMEAMQSQASTFNLPGSPDAEAMRMMAREYTRVADLADRKTSSAISRAPPVLEFA